MRSVLSTALQLQLGITVTLGCLKLRHISSNTRRGNEERVGSESCSSSVWLSPSRRAALTPGLEQNSDLSHHEVEQKHCTQTR